MQYNGKVERFEQLILPVLDAAYNLARWLTRNEHDAEDVVQEAYLRAFKFFDSYDGRDPRVWFLAIVRNTCFTFFRKDRRDAQDEFDEQVHLPQSAFPDAEEQMVREVDINLLREALEQLPVDYREVLVLREFEELSYKEIAAMLSLPIGTVMSRLTRARQRLLKAVQAKAASMQAPGGGRS